jgi:glycerate kinase
VRVLVAPDKFRGTLTAAEAASAIATGWRRARPADEIDLCPVADGGEGTMSALLAALGGEAVAARVRGPLGDPVDASFGVVDLTGVRSAIVESASASGLGLVLGSRRDPVRAGTEGTGELIGWALDRGIARLLVCVGGTASSDGGAGMARALGARFLRADGSPIRTGGGGLVDLATIDLSTLDPRIRRCAIDAWVDVDNPLTGPTGASVTFGPQKGASPEDVVLLDRALAHLAAVVHRDLGIDLRELPGAGAGGGLGFGAVAFLGARLRPGADLVAEVVGLRARLARADVVVTGEGRFDRQSLGGKAPGSVLRLAHELGVPGVVLCGEAEPGMRDAVPGLVAVVSLVERSGREAAMADARGSLEGSSAALAGKFGPSGIGDDG